MLYYSFDNFLENDRIDFRYYKISKNNDMINFKQCERRLDKKSSYIDYYKFLLNKDESYYYDVIGFIE